MIHDEGGRALGHPTYTVCMYPSRQVCSTYLVATLTQLDPTHHVRVHPPHPTDQVLSYSCERIALPSTAEDETFKHFVLGSKSCHLFL